MALIILYPVAFSFWYPYYFAMFLWGCVETSDSRVEGSLV